MTEAPLRENLDYYQDLMDSTKDSWIQTWKSHHHYLWELMKEEALAADQELLNV